MKFTGSQAEVIQVLEQREPLSLKELGSLLICENGSPSRLVNGLVLEGLVNREVNPQDSRSVILRLSEVGKEKARKISAIERDLYTLISNKITPDQMEIVSQSIISLLSTESIARTLQDRGYMN